MNIFPELKKAKWAEINLEKESKKVSIDFANPRICEKWLEKLHKENKVNYSFGGFLEDRKNLWKNTYLKGTNRFLHTAVDYNVPFGTKVVLPVDVFVEDVLIDPDQNGGWGGSILAKVKGAEEYILFAHLAHKINLLPKKSYKKGKLIGKTGKPSENGGWFNHLHVQLMKTAYLKKNGFTLKQLDGYIEKDSPDKKFILHPKKYVKQI